jgi:hypothetical protein
MLAGTTAEKGKTMVNVNEVKKALHSCIDNESNCAGCVYREYKGGFCIDALMRDAITLLEQQEEEIRRLTAGRKDNENECNT